MALLASRAAVRVVPRSRASCPRTSAALAAALLLSAPVALAADDACVKRCVKECGVIAPGSPEYCRSACADECGGANAAPEPGAADDDAEAADAFSASRARAAEAGAGGAADTLEKLGGALFTWGRSG